MKTKFTIYMTLGGETNTDYKNSALNTFDKQLNAKALIDNTTGDTLKSREHIKVGVIRSGIKFMGNIHIYECSDNGRRITKIGEPLDKAIQRISAIDKNRVSPTEYEPIK